MIAPMDYYRLSAGARGYDYVRIDVSEMAAEIFDTAGRAWTRRDVYYDEVLHNGNGEEITEAEAFEALGLLQSA